MSIRTKATTIALKELSAEGKEAPKYAKIND